MHYFLAEDLDLLERKMAETVKKIKDIGEELRTAISQSSETWHDNFGFENAQQQGRMLSQRLDDLEQIRRNATMIERPSNTKTISIGHTVIAKDGKTGTLKTFRIGSHIAFAQNTISYVSPIGSLLLDKKVGERVKGAIGAKEFDLKIVRII